VVRHQPHLTSPSSQFVSPCALSSTSLAATDYQYDPITYSSYDSSVGQLASEELALHSRVGQSGMSSNQAMSPPQPITDIAGFVFSETSLNEPNTKGNRTEKSSLISLDCPTPWCDEQFESRVQVLEHMRILHKELQGCASCSWQPEDATSNTSLFAKIESHAARSMHVAFRCPLDSCLSTFSRFDALQRHYVIHQKNSPRHECKHCKKYQGIQGFKRLDHLEAHLRNYHRINLAQTGARSAASCPRLGCKEYRVGAYKLGLDDEMILAHNHYNVDNISHAFQTTEEYRVHMKKEHNFARFPCFAKECERIGGKGYWRKRDLEKHQAKEHRDEDIRITDLGYYDGMALEALKIKFYKELAEKSPNSNGYIYLLGSV
jgi:hypothetical protein